MKRLLPFCSLLVLLAFIASACGAAPPAAAEIPAIAPPTLTPSPQPPPPPTETLVPTAVPTGTPVPHPLEIRAMRAVEYPGSDIIVEAVLDPGVNYNR